MLLNDIERFLNIKLYDDDMYGALNQEGICLEITCFKYMSSVLSSSCMFCKPVTLLFKISAVVNKCAIFAPQLHV